MFDFSKLNFPKKKIEILSTASDLFQRFGIKRISVEEICQTSRVSKMTFYKYFKNKNELVRFMWQEGFNQALEKFDEIATMDISFDKKLQLILKMKEENAEKISHEFALEYFYATPALKDFFEEMSRKSITHFLNFIKDAQRKGEVRSDLHPEFLLAVINNLKLLVKDANLVKKYPTYKDFVLEINNFIFYGILPEANQRNHDVPHV